jgi:hypothetical protein
MHGVVETATFASTARAEGLTAEEVREIIDIVSADPKAGELIVGSGGCRKLRVAARGKGKSGGFRVVTYYAGRRLPVGLIAVLAKGSRETFSDREVQAMKALTAGYAKAFRAEKLR